MQDGQTVYTATVTFDGKTYEDTQTSDLVEFRSGSEKLESLGAQKSVTVVLNVPCTVENLESAKLLFAAYDKDGRMIQVQIDTVSVKNGLIALEKTYTLTSGAASIHVFLTTDAMVPLIPATELKANP